MCLFDLIIRAIHISSSLFVIQEMLVWLDKYLKLTLHVILCNHNPTWPCKEESSVHQLKQTHLQNRFTPCAVHANAWHVLGFLQRRLYASACDACADACVLWFWATNYSRANLRGVYRKFVRASKQLHCVSASVSQFVSVFMANVQTLMFWMGVEDTRRRGSVPEMDVSGHMHDRSPDWKR